MSDALRPRRRAHAVRPLRRRARRRAARTTSPRTWSRALLARAPRPRPGADRRRPASATPTAPARTTATSRAWPCCSPGCRRACPGATVNRLCGSSLEAAIQAQPRRSRPATPTLVLVGGVESMSRAPWVLLKPEQRLPAPGTRRCTRPRSAGGWSTRRCPSEWTISLGESAEKLAEHVRRSRREAQDAFALRSHQLRRAAWDDGFYDDWVVPGRRAPSSTRDEGIRADTLAGEARPSSSPRSARTARSPPATRRRSTTAPPRCCSSATRAPPRGRARAAGPDRRPRGVRGVDPDVFGIGPVEAAEPGARARRDRLGRRRRGRAQRGVRGAVAGLPGRVARARPRRSSTSTAARSRIGHPLGASGARILGTLAHELHRRGGG